MLWNPHKRYAEGRELTCLHKVIELKTELQLETEQQIHFRSVIKLSALHDPLPLQTPMEDSDDVSTGPAQSESSSSKYSSALLCVRVMSETREVDS